MTMPPSYTSFAGHHRIAAGSLQTVALAVKQAQDAGLSGPVLTFDDDSGRVVEIDTRGSNNEVLARLTSGTSAPEDTIPADEEPRGRGRPRLGVVAREVTLLPRHWDWLNGQPGGASVTLRKLVDEARRENVDRDRQRHAQERAYRFMSAIAGDLPGFEDATRALFAQDQMMFDRHTRSWPDDLRAYATRLAFGVAS
ncbi:DUF2239 family protein [Noviherbaspirillum sp. ST9]|uniref:DUF2239 family protein n=1 Tax=Noviherbaspirillum sp. ST9 TaxID=3401606 RepID=UPI003B58917C